MFLSIKKIFIPCRENQYRPGLLYGSFMFWAVVAMVFLHAIPLVFFANLPRNSEFADITKSAIINLTNQERKTLGLSELSENKSLDEAAYQKALNMFKDDYFDHFSPTGISPWFWFEKSGYKYDYAGENLAIGFLEPEEVYKGWQESFTHHQNILNGKYEDIGVAVVRGNFNGAPTTIVVQMFGSQKEDSLAQESLQDIAGTTKSSGVQKSQNDTKGIVLEDKNSEVRKKVAGQAKESEASSDAQDIFNNQNSNFKQKSVQFFAFHYNDLMQQIIIVIVSVFSFVAFWSFAFYFKNQRPSVLAKSIATVIFLLLFAYLEKEKIISIIPHKLIIQ
ncbi:hypothetical protein KBC01_02080 [Candidatus Parcubacteria bacterium]|nr:hypothetical protein [Candidatus Parcubacteria bacterium]